MDLKIIHKSSVHVASLLREHLNSDLHEDCRDYKIELPPSMGEGNLRFIDFVDVVSLFAIDATLDEELVLNLGKEANLLMRFNYCMEGEMHHRLFDGKLMASLNSLNGSVSANRAGCAQTMIFPPNVKIKFLSIELDRENYQDKLPCDLKMIPEKLMEVLEDKDGSELFHYQHNYAHIIHEEAKEIFEDKYRGLIKTTHQEAKALEIIAQQYKQYKDDINTEKPKKILKEYEIQKLSEARQILRNNMSDPPTIVELAKRVGLNQQKLKTGFKKLYESTINNYVQKLRLEHTRALLMTGKFTVKEAADEVGYENKSFLARKFKERFGILPSEMTRQVG